MANDAHSMNSFLEAVEGRAFYMARLGTRNDADALDIIQDSMTRFVEHMTPFRRAPDRGSPLITP